MEKEFTCCFTGHRDLPPIKAALIKMKTKKAILELIEKGVTDFISGGAVGYDILCGEIVLSLKKTYPDIKLHIAVPCKNQEKYYSPEYKKRYNNLLSQSDGVYVLSDHYYSGCMHRRNKYMVDNSAYLVAYCVKDSGGTYYTLNYARSKDVEIINTGM